MASLNTAKAYPKWDSLKETKESWQIRVCRDSRFLNKARIYVSPCTTQHPTIPDSKDGKIIDSGRAFLLSWFPLLISINYALHGLSSLVLILMCMIKMMERGDDHEQFGQQQSVCHIPTIWNFHHRASLILSDWMICISTKQEICQRIWRIKEYREEPTKRRPIGVTFVFKCMWFDINFGSTNKKLCIAFEKLMLEKFQMSSMRELALLFGIYSVARSKEGIFIVQDKCHDWFYDAILLLRRPDIMLAVCA
ncbi:hypothetical protein Tco_0727355 [Tanacetum coccineum]|uniref:Uncharacterized protein n=1 Tax=Tanacetum coccineum TaxID=301880 RepID=A0ABQ4YI48_9ASTR